LLVLVLVLVADRDLQMPRRVAFEAALSCSTFLKHPTTPLNHSLKLH
jgi:hypothetical protein